MKELIPPINTISGSVLGGVGGLTKYYLQNKFFQDTSMDRLPFFLGNATNVLITTDMLLGATKDFTGNISTSLVPFERVD